MTTALKAGVVASLAPVPAWDVRCRQAHAAGRVALYMPPAKAHRWTWQVVPNPPPGKALATWPAVQP